MKKTNRSTRRRRGRALLLIPALALLVLPARVASADACSDCSPATAAEIQSEQNVSLRLRAGVLPGTMLPLLARDYISFDAGDCVFTHLDTIQPHMIVSLLELKASGEVWNCPESKSSATITARVSKEDRTDWSETVGLEGEAKTIAASMKVKYSRSSGGGSSITETTDLAMTVQAAYCHRLPWLAYLEVGRFSVTESYALTQPYAWWTKNVLTGATVHSSGSHDKDCGTATVTLERNAPLSWTVRLAQESCGAGCESVKSKDLGFRPRLPEHTPEPPVPAGTDWPAPSPEPSPDEPPAPAPDGPPAPAPEPDDDDGPPPFSGNSGDLPPPPAG